MQNEIGFLVKLNAIKMDESPEPVENRTVLLVDDSRSQRRMVSAMLKRWGYDVIEAASGEEAMEICTSRPIELVISDWMMPGISGLEFCKQFRALEGDEYGYFLLLTSKSETSEMIHGLEGGADEFLTKPVSAPELKARLLSAERILEMQSQLSAKNAIITSALDELQGLYDAIDRDLMQARKIQESLVPRKTLSVGGSNVSLLIKPCGHVGGDLVGMFSPSENWLAFYNIDVSGHGITSALMTARLAGYLSADFLDSNVAVERRFEKFFSLKDPGKVAEILNQRLMHDNGVGEYFTMAFGTIDLTTGLVKMVQAGHPHPIVQRADGSVEFTGEGGLPIGLVDDVTFEDYEIQLQKGDRILLHSDGFTEAVGPDGNMLEEPGMEALLTQVSDRAGLEMLDDLFWQLQNLRGDEPLEDDVSATLFEFGGP